MTSTNSSNSPEADLIRGLANDLILFTSHFRAVRSDSTQVDTFPMGLGVVMLLVAETGADEGEPATTTVTDICSVVDFPKSSVSRYLSELLQMGLVVEKLDEKDRRRRLFSATPKLMKLMGDVLNGSAAVTKPASAKNKRPAKKKVAKKTAKKASKKKAA